MFEAVGAGVPQSEAQSEWVGDQPPQPRILRTFWPCASRALRLGNALSRGRTRKRERGPAERQRPSATWRGGRTHAEQLLETGPESNQTDVVRLVADVTPQGTGLFMARIFRRRRVQHFPWHWTRIFALARGPLQDRHPHQRLAPLPQRPPRPQAELVCPPRCNARYRMKYGILGGHRLRTPLRYAGPRSARGGTSGARVVRISAPKWARKARTWPTSGRCMADMRSISALRSGPTHESF